jgi:hypothetical protein
LYNKILVEVKPSQPAAMVTFVDAFDPDFALLLRERRSTYLTKIQDDALPIESNMMESGKLKAKIETENKENRKFKEQGGSSRTGKSLGDKIDEMDRLIRELSNKISKMELDKSKRDNFPRKDFRRNPDPEAPHKTIKNEDQKIPTPFKSENFIGEEDLEDFEEFDEVINSLGDNNKSPYLSRQDYEKSLNKEIRSEDNVSNDTSKDLAYEGIMDDIIAELHEKYNLRPRNKSLPTIPTKNILPRGETDEAAPKVADKQTAKTHTTYMQPVKPKSVGTPATKTQVPMGEIKYAPQRKAEKKGMEAPNIESEKSLGIFSLKNEINKIKMPILLFKLAKNPIYRKQIAKMISFSEDESQADVINLEYDKSNIVFGLHFEGARDTVAPFYITLTLFDHLLHNYMLDSGASHNVMPKSII